MEEHDRVDSGAESANSADIAHLKSQLDAVRSRLDTLEACNENRMTILVFSGDMDKLMTSFVLATGAAAMEMEVSMFFTFWGITALKKNTQFAGKTPTEKLMTLMLPKGPGTVGTSRLNMLGIGKAFFDTVMKQKNVTSLPELITLSQEMGVKLSACPLSMDLMGISQEELRDGVQLSGVATYVEEAARSRVSHFI